MYRVTSSVKMQSPSIIRYLRANPNATEEELILQEEAAHFARCLLMPEEKVKEILQLAKYEWNKVHCLSEIFAVPKNEMRYRLYELNLKI